MLDNGNTAYSPVLPFDCTYGEHFMIYDNMTYVRDLDLCDEESIRMLSGNIFKYFTCNMMNACKVGGD